MSNVNCTNNDRHWVLRRLERIPPEARTEQERRLHEKMSDGYTGTPIVTDRRHVS